MRGVGPSVGAYEGIAPYYDQLLGQAGFEAIWRAFQRARRRFALHWSQRGAADFGCGTGIFLQALAEAAPRAAPLYGVDISPAMLAQARRRLGASRKVKLIRADIRRVRLPQMVELIFCNFSTVNYLTTVDDLIRIINSFALNLVYEGHLIFDMLAAGRHGIETPFKQQIHLPDFEAEWWVAPRPDNRGSRTVMQNCIPCDGGEWRCWSETHVQRWWLIAEVVGQLKASGLECLAVTPVEAHRRIGSTGRWVQVVARRVR